jgi:hypothetical protein
VRAKQRTQFCAKSAKNDLKPTDFLERNFYFEIEGVKAYSFIPQKASSVFKPPTQWSGRFLGVIIG